MELQLDTSQASELHTLLSEALRELSSEIADTDNPAFQRQLRERRDHLQKIQRQLAETS
jgi:hypothetical protein